VKTVISEVRTVLAYLICLALVVSWFGLMRRCPDRAVVFIGMMALAFVAIWWGVRRIPSLGLQALLVAVIIVILRLVRSWAYMTEPSAKP
jgi:hypothetical protein